MKKTEPTCLACYRLTKQCGCKATCARCIAKSLRKRRGVRKTTAK